MFARLPIALIAAVWMLPAAALDESLFEDEEGGSRPYTEVPGSEWKELQTGLPDYPRDDNLIELDVSDYNFPFAVFVDKKSLSVADDRIVRYTVVVRSRTGADNVSYEGIQCNQRRVKRYGYGSNGRMHEARNAEWRFIRRSRQDSYRNLLASDVFCPLPMGDQQREIIRKLKARSVNPPGYFHNEEE